MNRIVHLLKHGGVALATTAILASLLAGCGGGGQPDAPSIGTATAGNAQASVTFTAPINDGGATITSYTVTSTPGNLTASGSASPITVTGLSNGTSYSFRVTASNIGGTSAPSSPSNSVTPTASIPGAPTIVAATAGNAQASVSFTAPVDTGGYAITSYTVTSTPGNLTASGSTSPLTVTGLLSSTTYSFTVTASNSNGMGPASAASNSITTSEGRENAPKVIALPYAAGTVGTEPADSFYRYTGAASSITATALTGDIDLEIYTDATFATPDTTNWTCSINGGVTDENCTASVSMPSPIFIKVVNYSLTGATFTLQTP